MLLSDIVNKVLLNETVSVNDINNAIDGHNKIIINYKSNGEDKNGGARVIEIYAYGLTKAGNPVIRAYQPYGDTTTRVPNWKFFRIDRITAWRPTGQRFDNPPKSYYKSFGEFNQDGDKSMSIVFKIAKFGDKYNNKQSPLNAPERQIYKTDTEKGMERLRQQLKNPIKLSDFKVKNGFKDIRNNTKTPDVNTPNTSAQKNNMNSGSHNAGERTDQPSDFYGKEMTMSDFNKLLSNNSGDTGQDKRQNLYKTPTEYGMERLRQQLDNPKKIDLGKIPRR